MTTESRHGPDALEVVVAVAGRIGAGKSAVAGAVADALDAERTSFGRVVRGVAAERGLPQDRRSLQALGEQLIAQEGWAAFTRRVLPSGTGSVVIDGVRHLDAVPALRGLASPRRFILVFVDAGDTTRHRRLAVRDHVDPAAVMAADGNANEAQTDAVRALADVVVRNDVDGCEHLETAAAAVLAHLTAG